MGGHDEGEEGPESMRHLAVTAALLLCLVASARAEDDEAEFPSEVPVRVEAEVDASEAGDLGRYVLRLAFHPEEDVRRAYRIQLRVRRRGVDVLQLDHAPEVPTPRWRKGEVIRYDVPFPVPLEAGFEPGTRLDLVLGFFDPEADQVVPPRAEEGLWGVHLHVGHVEVPELAPTDDAALRDRLLASAKALAEAGRKPDAWRLLEMGLRRAAEDPTKEHFRDGILALGHFSPRPVSTLERGTVAERIAAEKRRYLRKEAGRYYDRGKLYAALRILEAVGGSLSEESDAAVIGALAEAERTQKDIDEIRVRILGRVTDEDKAAARKALEKGSPKKHLEKAAAWAKKKQYARARLVLRALSLSGDRDLAGEARRRLQALEHAWLADTPPDEAEMVEHKVNHAAFGRLGTVATHNFIFIGPRTLVENVPNDSRLRYDLAFVFLTDLFGRSPNPNGARITVFFKELWDFGGGQAAGNKIDIGRADKDKRGYRVDTGLLYHELTHCIDDTLPIFVGHREGLANMGAAYLFEALDQEGDSLHAFARNLDAFQQDYVGRDLAYWRIPSYGPSAGFFLHFLETYSKAPWGHDWKPYRAFFRAYRQAPVRDGREPYVARALAYYLMQAFGPEVFDDLLAFRLPLVESDRDAVKIEVDAFARGEYQLQRVAPDLASFENSPLPRDLVTRAMLQRAMGGRSGESLEGFARDELGILHDWWVVGPFKSQGADPRVHVFPPEYEIDFEKEYLSGNNMCKWRKAGDTPIVTVDAMGWVAFNYSYQDNTATYALNHVMVPKATDVHVHVRSDDDVTLFLNDRRVEGYVIRGSNGSSQVWWRGPYARVPDAMRFPTRLEAGRNKLLVKVKNRRGKAGFVLAVSRRDGGPVPEMKTDLDPPATGTEEAPPKTRWKTVVKHSFRTKSFGAKLETTVGTFKVVGRRLEGQSKDKGVAWRQYTVRPGFPKDSPSNLFWLREKHTQDLTDFRLKLDLVPKNEGVPKLVVTFQGEGEDDGLSGWNLIVHPRRKDVGARLERYDHVAYQTTPLPAPGGEVQRLVLTYRKGGLTVTLGDTALFVDVPIRAIPGRTRIGVSTFGPDLGIAAFDLEKPVER